MLIIDQNCIIFFGLLWGFLVVVVTVVILMVIQSFVAKQTATWR